QHHARRRPAGRVARRRRPDTRPLNRRKPMALVLTSKSFKEGDMLAMEQILSADYGFGCGGGNKSPHLAWSGVPAGTKSFAVSCFDPDAPTGSGLLARGAGTT